MVEKLTGKMDILVAVGFGFFLAWRQNVINFLYPMSAGLVFSPLVCMSFACCLVLVLALVAFRSNQATFSSRFLVSMPAVLIVAATLCAYLVAKDFGGMALAYVAALVIGVAAIVPHSAIADSLMEKISQFVESASEAEVWEETREIR
mgnify:CR=1 FL=1